MPAVDDDEVDCERLPDCVRRAISRSPSWRLRYERVKSSSMSKKIFVPALPRNVSQASL